MRFLANKHTLAVYVEQLDKQKLKDIQDHSEAFGIKFGLITDNQDKGDYTFNCHNQIDYYALIGFIYHQRNTIDPSENICSYHE